MRTRNCERAYSFSISPNLSHCTTLLDTKVLNLYILNASLRFETWQHGNPFIKPGVKAILSRRSCPEATAIRNLDIPGWVFVFRQEGALSMQHHRFPGLKGRLLDFIPLRGHPFIMSTKSRVFDPPCIHMGPHAVDMKY